MARTGRNRGPGYPGELAKYTEFVTEAGTTVILTLNHLGKTVFCTNAAAITFSLIATGIPDGARFDVIQDGAGQITFAQGTGVSSIKSEGSNLKSGAQNVGITAQYRGLGVWWLGGNLTT